VNITDDVSIILYLPNCSETGARMRGAHAQQTRKLVRPAITAKLLQLHRATDFPISGAID
jgi:hypothetical protein